LVLLLNISYKKRQHKKEIYSWPACYTYAGSGGLTVYIIYIKAVVVVILLLTFAVTFLLQEDFFLVGTSRA
jgi:hypothetical protein